MISHPSPATNLKPSIVTPSPAVLGRLRSLSWLMPVVLFALFTILYTFPMLLHFTTDVPGVLYEDRMQNLWNFWWIRRAISSGHNPYHTDMLFYPYFAPPNPPLPLYFHDLQLFNGLVTLPLQLIGGLAAAYNGVVWGAIFVSGLGTYWLIRRCGGSRLGAVVGGCIYAFCPFRTQTIQQSITNIQSTEFLPLYALCLIAVHRSNIVNSETGWRNFWRGLNKGWLVGAIVAFTCCVYTDWYNTLYLVTFSLFYSGWRVLRRPFTLQKFWHELLFMLIIAGGVFVLTAPLVVPGIGQLNNPALTTSLGFDREVNSSATLIDLFRPGSVVLNFATTYSGYASLLLLPIVILAVFRLKAGTGKGWLSRSNGLYWLLLTGLAFVLTLGPELRLTKTINTHIPTPYALLRLLPAVSFTRAPIRFIILAMLGLAVLSAFALDWIRTVTKPNLRRIGLLAPRRSADAVRFGLAGIVLGLLVLESWSPLPLYSTAGKAIFETIKNEPGNFKLLELPITRHYNKDMVRMFNQISHERPIMGGYLSRPVFDYYRTPDSPFGRVSDLVVRTQKRTPTDIIPTTTVEDDLDNLALSYNFRYVVVYLHEYDDPAEASGVLNILSQHYGSEQKIYSDPDLIIYRVPDNLATKVPSLRLDLAGGWYDIERSHGDLWRWTGAGANLYATTYADHNVTVKLNVAAFAKERTLQLKVNGQNAGQLKISPAENITYALDLNLPRGRNEITLTSLEGDQLITDIAPDSHDTRRLAFKVFSIQLTCNDCKS